MATSGTTRRIRLPGDLARSLDDTELRNLWDAVNDEIERRRRITATKRSTRSVDKEAVQIPEGQVNLIGASFKAGLKPAAIARTLGVSLSLVRRICSRMSVSKALAFARRCYPDEPLSFGPSRPSMATS